MSEAVSVVSDAASNEIAVIAGKVMGNILTVALFVAPIVLLYFLIVNFRKLIIELREKQEMEKNEAAAGEERKRLLDEMENEEGSEAAESNTQDHPEENQEE